MSTTDAGNPAQQLTLPQEAQPGQDSPVSRSSSERCQVKLEKEVGGNDNQNDDWDNDVDNPQNFSKLRKRLITGAALFGTLIVPLNGTSITVAARQLDAQFNISDATFANSYWAVTSWSVGGAIFILVGLPLLEDLGIRLGFLTFYAFFFVMIIPQAVAQNFATLIVSRFFSGGCVTLLANVCTSIIPDLYVDDRERSVPVSLFILAYMAGNSLAPPLFAGIVQYTGNWRWIFYVQLIIYGAFFPVFFFLIRETRPDVILRRRRKLVRKETKENIQANPERSLTFQSLGRALYRPLYLQATEPVLFTSTLWSAFCTGNLYLFTQSTEQVYGSAYGWDAYSAGYVQSAIVVGLIIGWCISPISTQLYFQSAARNKEFPGRPVPEARLYLSVFGSFVGLSGGMFVYAWTSYSYIHWIAPTIGLAMVGFGIQVVVTAIADYIVDAYADSSFTASAVSGIAAAENIFGGFLPFATLSMYRQLGPQWASSVLGFVALLLSFAPVVFIWKGRWFRERSPFMLSGGKTWTAQSDQ